MFLNISSTINTIGGEWGARTLAPHTRPNSLANCPLHHLGNSPNYFLLLLHYNNKSLISQYFLLFFYENACLKVKKNRTLKRSIFYLAEEVGFEPTVPFDITSFQDWLLKPLGHSSIRDTFIIISLFFCLSILKEKKNKKCSIFICYISIFNNESRLSSPSSSLYSIISLWCFFVWSSFTLYPK